ncbi:MAG: hypothetical protein GX806_03770, partial [Lentisphaerae bacterium]|nr:hypothetical protein [Lentisphaerota bacterium]
MKLSFKLGSVALALLWACSSQAASVSESMTHLLAQNWLDIEAWRLHKQLPTHIAGLRAFADAQGRILYRVADLAPQGYIILATDDNIEPIIAFSDQGSYESSPQNP